MKGKVLVVDDEKNITLVVQAMLERAGLEALVFNDSKDALQAIPEGDFHAVITDLYMPGANGMEILRQVQATRPRVPVVVITAFGTVEAAVSALKQGAFDFVTKPFDQSDLLGTMQKALQTYWARENEILSPGPLLAVAAQGASSVNSMIGSGAKMQEIFRIIAKVASSPSTVLVYGESGTGKELVAYEIHRLSDRAKNAFIKINCAAIPSTLIESELFGHEKGAFTGAVTSKPGRFELADGGTIFLDEVAEMPLEMQVKLLRVLQEREFERVGGVTTIQVDVRVVAATNKDLEKEVQAGRFREDLFYRLNVVPMHLPPLRDRVEDIELLVGFFLSQFNLKLNKSIMGVEPACMQSLKSYRWPGNIRQLENVIERMVLLCDRAQLGTDELPEQIRTYAGGVPSAPGDGAADSSALNNFKEIVRKQTQSVERELIERALEETEGNITRAAERLGLSRKGLQIKLKELGIRKSDSAMVIQTPKE